MRRFRWFLLSICVCGTIAQAQSPANVLPPDLDSFVTSVMTEFRVPGIGLAIVKDGKALLTNGYGVRALGSSAPVDARTRFGIASNTKLFTATAIGLLVEEGKLNWDSPVVRYMPSFAMYDAWVTREITVRDLLVHRSGLGLGAGDLLWWPQSTYDRKEIVRRLRFIAPATSFRSAYAYDNVLYTVAGELIEAVSGMPWEDFIAKRILGPAGMTGTSVRHSDAGRGENIAKTHAEVDGLVRGVPPMEGDNVNPAGGINTSAEDIAKWLIVQLDSGRLSDGRRLYQPATTVQLWTLVTPIPAATPAPELAFQRASFNGYGLGIGVRDYRGVQMLTHTGALPGYYSRVTMIPGMKLGVAVLTNQESSPAYNAIVSRIVDHFLGATPVDYLTIYRTVARRDRESVNASQTDFIAARDSTARPTLPLSRYAGKYTDAWYGDIRIVDQNTRLAIRFSHTPSLVGDLVPWEKDTFLVRWRDRSLRADAYLTFKLGPSGRVASATMKPASPDVDFSYDFQDLLLKPIKR